MKNLLAAVTVAGMAVGVATPAVAEQLVRVGLAPEPGAFTQYDAANGHAAGATIEVLQAIAKLQGLTLSYVLTPGAGSNPGVAALKADKIDVIGYTFQITPERLAQIAFSDPVLAYGEALAVQKSDPRAYHGSADLKGVTVAVINGSNYVDIARRVGAIGVPGNSLVGAIADVNDGKVGAVIGTAPTLIYMVQHGNNPNVRLVADYHSSDVIPAGFGVLQTNTALLAKLNAGLATLKADGTLKAILAKYGI